MASEKKGLGQRQDDQGQRQDEQGARQELAEGRLSTEEARGARMQEEHDDAIEETRKSNKWSSILRKALIAWIILFTLTTGYGIRTNRSAIVQLRETKASSADLRAQINELGRKGCFGSRINVRKYNDLVSSIIEGRLDQYNSAINRRDFEQAKLHKDAIARYRKDFLPVATVRACNTPIVRAPAERPH